LKVAVVATPPVIRHRLLSIALLGLVTSALSILALYRAVSTTAAVRRQRAADIVAAESERLARLPPTRGALAEPPGTTYLGLHGGWLERPADVAAAPGLAREWWAPVEAAATAALATQRRAERDAPFGDGTLVVAARPAAGGGVAWAAYKVLPFSSLDSWRWTIVALFVATALLVTVTLGATLSFRRSATQLNATLTTLAKDLATPVPRPRVAELAGIADGIRAMAADLLASREATERLGRELAQQERLAALGRVAAGVAHEVRNPLASIKLRLDLTATTSTLPEPARKAVASASDEIARLDRLVSDLLLVAGNKIGPRHRVDVAALVQARAEALGPWATARGVSLRVGGEGEAEADSESVARALDNLLRNAVEASPAGAAVAVTVTGVEGRVEVAVADRGRGVEPARVGELFEPFFTTKAEGTGLGLAISRAIARAHGGELTYVRRDQVTRFCLSLPARMQARQAASSSAMMREIA
jgi:signal transduction histidine kinase